MRRLLTLAAALLLGACDAGQDGMIVMIEPGWRAEMIARSGDGFDGADGLHWADGRLYIADEAGSAVRVWSGKGKVRTLADAEAGLASPEDLVVAPDGTVYFTDDDAGGVKVAAPDGRVAAVTRGVGSTEGIALAPSGALVVGDADGRRVLRIVPGGAVSVLAGPESGLRKPESLAFDASGYLYIADNEADVLWMLGPDGRMHRPVADRPDFSPETIHFAGGDLFVTDSANGKLYRFSPEGGLQTVAVFAGDLAQLAGVTSDEAGRVYLSVQTDLKRKQGYLLRLERTRQTGADGKR